MDGWRLAVGTLTALPVRAPAAVTRATALAAMLLAPIAVLPLAAAVVLVVELPLSPFVVAVLAVGVLVLGTRALHVDGLSDTADGLTASYDAERSLDVMKSGASGPAGGAAVLLVLLLQVGGFASLAGGWRSAALAGLVVCVSRAALAMTCARGVPGARPDGLGGTYVGVVPVPATVAVWLVAGAVVSAAAGWAGMPWWRGALAVVLAALVLGLLVRRTVVRFGGVTGDVFGAAVEVCLATLLVALA